MKVNDIIKQVATYLQLTNVVGADLSDFENLDAQTKKDINLIVSSMNEVLSDVATDYLPLCHTETIEVENGSFDLNTLEKAFYKLIKVKTNKPYHIDFETLKIDNGIYQVDYMYLPELYEIGDEILEFDSRLTLFALCFGVAGEFCLISGNYSESELWNSKYENAMQVAISQKKIFSLKERRWI